jgi:hypothetical protein
MFEGQAPPPGATVLFNGVDLRGWSARGGGPAGWRVEDGSMVVVPGTGDIVSDELFEDALVHVEFVCPDMPDAAGQAKANSGVYIQGRYEIQVLDSHGVGVPGRGDCGAIYNQLAPLLNACRPALAWQSYDVVFREARIDGEGRAIAQARMTVFQNGAVIHNNVEVEGPTGRPIDHDIGRPGPLLLQDHRDLVRYRNVWIVRLPPRGSNRYEPG